MKALPKRKGNTSEYSLGANPNAASMKALPKRKGNYLADNGYEPTLESLNESPSEKEGKFRAVPFVFLTFIASMKALPKRKGNVEPYVD